MEVHLHSKKLKNGVRTRRTVTKSDALADRYVKINVGGALFQTTVGTLTKHDTMLRAMFSGRMQVVTDSNGWVLIDRSGRHFGIILDFLRDGFVPLPDCRVEVEQILAEARYYLVQELAAECQSWLETLRVRRDVREPMATCSIPVVHTKAEADRLVLNSIKPAIKLLINRHNNKYSYTSQSDDNIMKNLELFDRLAVKFHDRILFIAGFGQSVQTVCYSGNLFGKGEKRAEVCCTSIVYATDKKQTKVEFPDSKIYDEAMSILRYEERGLCSRCGGEACSPKEAVPPSEGVND
ncbi:K+ channel tetramerization domain protein [Cooperia oncophora]